MSIEVIILAYRVRRRSWNGVRIGRGLSWGTVCKGEGGWSEIESHSLDYHEDLRNVGRKLSGTRRVSACYTRSDSQLNGEPPSKEDLVDEFSLGRNGRALVSPLFSHRLGAALEEPGLGMKDWKVGVMNLKATTRAGSSTTRLPAAGRQIS